MAAEAFVGRAGSIIRVPDHLRHNDKRASPVRTLAPIRRVGRHRRKGLMNRKAERFNGARRHAELKAKRRRQRARA
jgi:hypothetical protein